MSELHKGKGLYISNIPQHLNEEQLFALFKKYGPLQNVKKMSAANNCNRAYGYLNYESHGEAVAALRRIAGADICGMKVSMAHVKASHAQNLSKWENLKDCSMNGPSLEIGTGECISCGKQTLLRCSACKAFLCDVSCGSSIFHKCALLMNNSMKDRNTKHNEGGLHSPSQKSTTSVRFEIPVEAGGSKFTSFAPQLEESEMVNVCFVSNPHDFWIHRCRDLEKLKEIAADLAALKIQHLNVVEPKEMCASPNGEDSPLYRSRIANVFENNTCEVNYIDYGNSSIVPTSALCHLTPKLQSEPPLAIHCKLNAVHYLRSQWDFDATALFIEVVECKSLHVHIIDDKISPIGIDLLFYNDVSASEILANNKKAVWYESSEVRINEIPTVFDGIKAGTYWKVTPFSKKDVNLCFWLDIKNAVFLIKELEKRINRYPKQDITSRIAIGDVGFSFCESTQMFGRCYVMKKAAEFVYVRFIDYGTDDYVKRVYFLEPKDRIVCSPLVWLEKPKAVPEVIFKDLVSREFHAVVYSVSNDYCELQFPCDGFKVKSFPWSHRLGSLENESPEPPPVSSEVNCMIRAVGNSIEDLELVQFPNGHMKIIVRHVQSLNAIYCAPFVHENINANMAFSNSITEYCEKSDITPYCPLKEELVLAKFAKGHWCRAVVTDFLFPNYLVQYIDYGNYSVVGKYEMRGMEKKFMKYPRQVHATELKGISDIDDQKQLDDLKEYIAQIGHIVDGVVSRENNGDIKIHIPGWEISKRPASS